MQAVNLLPYSRPGATMAAELPLRDKARLANGFVERLEQERVTVELSEFNQIGEKTNTVENGPSQPN